MWSSFWGQLQPIGTPTETTTPTPTTEGPTPTHTPTSTPTETPTPTPTTETPTSTPTETPTPTDTPTPSPTSTPQRTNIALNQYAYASSEESGHPASHVNDGSMSTRWSSVQNPTMPQWVNVDLGSTKTFDLIFIYWENAYCTQIEINVSLNGSNWDTVWTSSTGGGTSNLQFLTPVDARWVSINCLEKNHPDWGVSIWEWEIYGW